MPKTSLDSELLSVLACPKCKECLTLAEDEKGLICEPCHLVYPVRNGVPILMIEEAFPQTKEGGSASYNVAEKVVLMVVEGKNKGEKVEIAKGMCRAMGRSLDDAERTRVFSMDSVITLDDTSKNLVVRYVASNFHLNTKQTIQPSSKGQEYSTETLGGFVRGPDFQVRDLAVSRLHAMFFCDESGTVGILDLVSKNGTFVNGAEVESKILNKGDLVTLGATKIRFEI